MNNSQLFGSEVVLRAGTQTIQGVPESLVSQVYIPATEVTETSDTPVTTVPIMSSPDVRDIVSYSTDSIAGNTLKTFLFSASSFIGKSISSATSAALFYIPTAGNAVTVAVGETMILAGITATNVSATTVEQYVQQYYAYATAGTAGTNWTFTGTLNTNFDLFLGTDSVTETTFDYLFFVAKDPLAALSALAVTGTHAGLVNNTNYALKTTVGSATQWNTPELVPYLEAAGLAPTFVTTLDYPASTRTMLQKVEDFRDAQIASRVTAMTALKNVKSLLDAVDNLELGTAGQAAITTLKTDINTLYNLQDYSYRASTALTSAASKAKNVFKDHIANGRYFSSTNDLKLAAADMDGLGFVTINDFLLIGNSITIQGRTFTNSLVASMSPADVVAEFISGTNLTGTITTNYSFSAKVDSTTLKVGFTGSMATWAVSKTSTQTGYAEAITVTYPLETVYETSTLRDTIVADIAALSSSITATTATLSALKAEISRAWATARAAVYQQDTLYTAGLTDWVTDLSTFAADATFFPNKLVFAYSKMTCNDSGILSINRMTAESQRMTEDGSRVKVTTLIDAVISSFDLSIMANQPPEISMTMTGEPYSVAFADGATIDFSEARLQTMPAMTGNNVTFISLAPASESYTDGNIQLQELSLPNMAGLAASRISTATGNFYRISADRVGRKLSLTLLDGDRSLTVGAITNYKSYINQKMKFRLQVGTLAGYIFLLEVQGRLTNVQPTTVQQALSGEQLELTATSVSLVWE